VGDFHARVGRQSTTSVSSVVRDATLFVIASQRRPESRKYHRQYKIQPSTLRLLLSERDGVSIAGMTQGSVGRLRADTSAIFTILAPLFQTTRELSLPATWILLVTPFRAHARAFRFQGSTTALSIRAAMYIRVAPREGRSARERPPVFSGDTVVGSIKEQKFSSAELARQTQRIETRSLSLHKKARLHKSRGFSRVSLSVCRASARMRWSNIGSRPT